MEAKAARIIQKRFREYASGKCNLTISQREFIRPWCKRWRTKSIFQVLLLYRAERLQTLVNFCLQIHLYNQNCLNSVLKTRDDVHLENVNFDVSAAEYLPPLKPPIPKLLFLWKNLNPRDASVDCEPLPDPVLEELEAEVQRNLSEKFSTAQKKPTTFEDKEIQTFLIEEKSDLPEELPIQPTTVAEEATESDDPNKIFPEAEKPKETDVKVIKIEEQLNVSIPEPEIKPETRNCEKLAGRPPSVKPRENARKISVPVRQFQSSINEMEEKFKNRNYNENGDDPPFNFRVLLKKTNHKGAPRRSSHEDFIFGKETPTLGIPKSLSCGKLSKAPLQSEMIVAEIAPGILVYGKLAHL